jgi:hypothetical protein
MTFEFKASQSIYVEYTRKGKMMILTPNNSCGTQEVHEKWQSKLERYRRSRIENKENGTMKTNRKV